MLAASPKDLGLYLRDGERDRAALVVESGSQGLYVWDGDGQESSFGTGE